MYVRIVVEVKSSAEAVTYFVKSLMKSLTLLI